MFVLICNSNQHLTEFIQIMAEETVPDNYGDDETCLEGHSGVSRLSPTEVDQMSPLPRKGLQLP